MDAVRRKVNHTQHSRPTGCQRHWARRAHPVLNQSTRRAQTASPLLPHRTYCPHRCPITNRQPVTKPPDRGLCIPPCAAGGPAAGHLQQHVPGGQLRPSATCPLSALQMPAAMPTTGACLRSCHRRLLQIADYPPLFNLIGNQFGGNGQSTFALPDLRGRVPLGYRPGSIDPVGEAGGFEQVTLTTNTIPSHNHDFTGAGLVFSATTPPNVRIGVVSAAGLAHKHNATAQAPAVTATEHSHSFKLSGHTHNMAKSGLQVRGLAVTPRGLGKRDRCLAAASRGWQGRL
jgi:microcystin-dependent protein